MPDRYISYIQPILDQARANGVDPKDILGEMLDALYETKDLIDFRTPEERDVRAAGMTSAALAFPRDAFSLRMVCAYNGVPPEKASPGWEYFPNEAVKAAWGRVEVAGRLAATDHAENAWEALYWAWRDQDAGEHRLDPKSASKMWGRVLDVFRV